MTIQKPVPAELRRPRRDFILLAAFAVAAALRLFRLGEAPLWLDEVTTAEWIRLGWSDTVRAALVDNHPPLYFVLLKAWALFAGDDTWLMRLPSAVLSWACVPLVAATAAALGGRGAARWGAWLTALAPQLLHHGQEARMYALLAALAAWHALLLIRFLIDPARRGLGIGFVLIAAMMAASHYYAVFFLAGEVLALVLLHPRPYRSWLPAAAGSVAAAAVALAAALLIAQQQGGEQYDLGVLAVPGAIWSMLSGYVLLPASEDLHARGWRAALPYLPIALAAAPAFLFLVWRGLGRIPPRPRVGIVATLVLGIGGPFLVSSMLGVGVNPRYLIGATPVLMTLLAIGLSVTAMQAAGRAAAAAMVATMTIGALLHLGAPGHGREDVAAAARWLQANVPPERTVLVTSDEMATLARFHWPQWRWQLYPPRRVVVGPEEAPRLANGLPFDDGRVFYVIGREWISDPDGALRDELAARYRSCPGVSVRGIEILCLESNDTDSRRAELGKRRPVRIR